jgi:REP element-mobilizing transposase RayT
MRPKQFNLFKKDLRFHGGCLLYGKRKSLRPLSRKDPIHIVLRSSWAYGENSFLLARNKKSITRLIERVAKKYVIKIYRVALVSNHLHLIIKISNRKNYHTFIRVLSGFIASHTMRLKSFKQFQEIRRKRIAGDPPTSAKKHQQAESETQGIGQAFWQFRPFTRILHWGRDFKTCCEYLLKNNLEANGFIPYSPRKNGYKKAVIEENFESIPKRKEKYEESE